MARTAQKKYTGGNCHDAALDRIRTIYDRFDHVAVSFSGGKDSTACLNLTVQVASELGRLPVRAIFYDEECIPPETVEYCERVAARSDVALEWYCIPCEQRNACSSSSPNWYPWAPEDRDKWVRPLPSRALTSLPDGSNPRRGLPELVGNINPPMLGSVGLILGIRTQESITRYRAIMMKARGDLAFISADNEFAKHVSKCYPIYDWTSEDVWLAPHVFGWDYNRAYDLMDKAGVTLGEQRCSPAFGEQPLRKLWCFPTCWPELWGRMSERVPGVNTAIRYANTELYGVGVKADEATPGSHPTWADLTRKSLGNWPSEEAKDLAREIRMLVRQHHDYTDDPMPDHTPHPVSGFCWRDVSKLAVIGDKFHRQRQKVDKTARDIRMKAGVQTTDRKSYQRKHGSQAPAAR